MVFVDNVVPLVPHRHQQEQQEQIVQKITEEIVKDELYCFHRSSPSRSNSG